MADDLHRVVLLAQRVAAGRNRYPSNADFAVWLKAEGLDHLAHRDRAALIRIAALDPQETSSAIAASTYTEPERLWYRVLRPLRRSALNAARTSTVPEAELPERIEALLSRLAGEEWRSGSENMRAWFYRHFIGMADILDDTTPDPTPLFQRWLDEQDLLELDDGDRALLMTLLIEEIRDAWRDIVLPDRPR